MASIPSGGFNFGAGLSFVANIGLSYTLNRFMAPDGPRLSDLSISGGDYGSPMSRIYGGAVRLPCGFIAQAPIKETKHTTDNTAGILIGAASGAAQGFSMGGPVGAVIGGVIGGIFGSKKHHYYTYSDTFGALIADRTADDPIEGVVKIWAAGRVLFDSSQQAVVSEVLDGDQLVSRKYGKNRYFKSLTIYGGGAVQTADPILNAKVGAQPGYRGTAYIVIEDLQLASFGNSVPAPIEVLAVAKTGQTLAEVAVAVCSAAGIDASRNLSTSALAGQVVRGYAVTSETNCWDALSPLMPVFRVDAGDINGQVRFYTREQGLRATIPLSEMGAYEYGSEPPERISYSRANDIGLPRETALTFIDPARDYQPNTATSRRSEGDARSNVASTVNLTMTADEGASAAATIHWDAWLGRTAVTTTLTDAWSGLTPGVCFGVPFTILDDPVVQPYRLTRVTRGANGLVEVEMVSAENVVVQGVTTGSDVPIDPDSDTAIPTTRAVLIDMPMLQDVHDDFGFYIAVGSDKDYWTQGRVDLSTDGLAWGSLVDVDELATVGDVTGTLGAGPTSGLDDTLDTTSVLTVVLTHDGLELTSATDAELDGWLNFAYVGKDGQGEYLQFKTATKVGVATWELSDLRRGRRGTDWAISAHGADEEFALLSDGGVYRIPFNNSSTWGTEYSYRAVTLHQDDDDAAVQEFTNTGEGKRPFSPVNFAGAFDGSYNLTLTWDRRARFFDGSLGTDAPEAYELDVWLSGVIVRTLTASTETVDYLIADQASDGFTDGDAIVIDLYQVNTDYGRGHVRRGAFLPPAFTMHMEDGTTPILMEDDLTPIGLG